MLVGEASIKLDAMADDLRRTLDREINGALAGVTVKSDPLVKLTQDIRKAELDLVQAEDALTASHQKVTAAEQELFRVRTNGKSTTADIAKAERALEVAFLQATVATDRNGQAIRRLTALRQEHRRVTMASQVSETSWVRTILGSSNAVRSLTGVLGIFNRRQRESGDAADSTGRRLRNQGNAASGLGRVLDGALRAPLAFITSGWQLMGAVGSATFSLLTSKALLLGGGIATILGPVGGLMLALPGLAFVGVGAFSAIALGMDGVKKAFEGLKPTIDTLKQQVSGSFQSGLTPAVNNLKQILPQLRVEFQSMAMALGGTLTQITNLVNTKAGIQALRESLRGAVQFVQGMQPGINALVQSFLTLGQTIAPQMQKLGGAIGSIFTNFNDAVNSLKQAGVLTGVFDGLIQIFKSLGNLVRPVVELLGRLAASLQGPLSKIIDAISVGLNAAMPGIEAFATSFGQVITALAPVLGAILPVIGQLAQLLGGVLATAITTLAPILTTLIQGLQGILAPLLPVIAASFQQLAEAVKPFAEQIAGVLLQALQALLPILPTLIDAMAQLLPVILQVVVAILPLIPPLLQLITTILPPLIQLWVQVQEPMLQFATMVLNFLVPILVDLIGVVTDVVLGIVNWFLNLEQNVTTIFTNINQFLLNVGKWIYENLIGPVVNVVREIKAKFEEARAFIGQLWDRIVNIVSTAARNVYTQVVGRFNEVTSFIGSLPGRIMGALGNLGNLLWQAGRDLLQGLINGIQSAVTGVINAVVGVGKKVINGIKGALGIGSPSRFTREDGGFLMAGLRLGIEAAASTVVGTAEAVAQDAVNVISEVFGQAGPNLGIDLSTSGLPDLPTVPNLTARRDQALQDQGALLAELVTLLGQQNAELPAALSDALESMNVVVSATEANNGIKKVQGTEARRR